MDDTGAGITLLASVFQNSSPSYLESMSPALSKDEALCHLVAAEGTNGGCKGLQQLKWEDDVVGNCASAFQKSHYRS